MVEKKMGMRIQTLRSDNGGEYKSPNFNEW
jgi:hypothetical protein